MIEIKEFNDKKYKVCNGTYYNIATSDEMIGILERIRISGKRVKFHWGDTETGRDWQEVYDVRGKIGRSMGPVRIPLLIQTANSLGGGGILDHCIVKITEPRKPYKVIWQHPKYHIPKAIVS